MVTIHKPKMIKLGKVNPQAYNPRRISAAKFESLKASIREHGFVDAIVVQQTGVGLIAGHQRRKALIELVGEADAMKLSVPAYVLDLDDDQSKILNIALNNTEGENDPDKMAAVIRSVIARVPLESIRWKASGLSSTEISNLIKAPKLAGGDDGGRPFASSVSLSLAFDSVAERDACKGLLAELSTKAGKKSGTIVRELLEGKKKRR
jgi:ParB-like chromosome segregation protein Spo0J